MSLTREEMKAVVAEAVLETLTRIGLDEEDHQELKRDFIYLRDLRKASDGVKRTALYAFITAVATATAAVLWLGLASLFKAPS